MGLDLWFREDVVRILAATGETMRALSKALSPSGSRDGEAYRQGFADALSAVATAFGVEVDCSLDRVSPDFLRDRAEIVDGEVLGFEVRPLDWPE
jgi:hypothetical protein